MSWDTETDTLAHMRRTETELRAEIARLEGLIYRKHGEVFQVIMMASVIAMMVAGIVGTIMRR